MYLLTYLLTSASVVTTVDKFPVGSIWHGRGKYFKINANVMGECIYVTEQPFFSCLMDALVRNKCYLNINP